MKTALLNPNEILPLVKSSLADHLYRHDKGRLDDLRIVKFMQRPFSTVTYLLAWTSNGTRKLIMKTIVNNPINRYITEKENQALVEYNILKFLYPRFRQVSDCSVPHPVLVIPEVETYLMDFVEGQSLMDRFRYARVLSSWRNFQDLLEQMNHCGKWLRLFQEFSGLELVEFDRNIFDIVIHRAEYRLKLIEESRLPACPKNFRSRVMAFLEEQLDQLSGKNILISGRHGDFNPLNILVGPEGITVIDFFGYQKDPVPIDILKILVCLDDEMRAVTSSKKRVTEMRKAFLDGYGELPHIQEPVLLLSEALHRIVSLWGNISNEKQRFHHRVEANLRIQAHVDWLTSEPNLTLLY